MHVTASGPGPALVMRTLVALVALRSLGSASASGPADSPGRAAASRNGGEGDRQHEAPPSWIETFRGAGGRGLAAEETTTGLGDLQAMVHVDGTAYTEAQIVAGEVEISEGSFIVGVKDKDNMEAVLEAAYQELDWEPTSIMTALGMFVGIMNQDLILLFLRSGEVNFIEADGVATISAETTTGLGEMQAMVHVDGNTYTEAQIVAGEVEMSEGVFIVGVKDKDNMEAVLEAAYQELDWEPMSIMTALGMFVGIMNQDLILLFLRSGEVKFIEADGVATIAAKTTTGLGNMQASVHVDGNTYTEAQIVAGEVEMSEGVFIVVMKDKDNMEAVLEAANQELSWEPTSIMTALGMFVGTMNQGQILWFLKSGNVSFIEADTPLSGALARSPALMILLYVIVLQ